LGSSRRDASQAALVCICFLASSHRAPVASSSWTLRVSLFNKTEESNWKVTWYRDLTIAVRERCEVDGFGPWTMKAGVLHVQPPAEIMSRILAVRPHLDETGPDNGPLRVIPASRRDGRLATEQLANWQNTSSVACTGPGRRWTAHASALASCVVCTYKKWAYFSRTKNRI
jgi:hypothetical protein